MTHPEYARERELPSKWDYRHSPTIPLQCYLCTLGSETMVFIVNNLPAIKSGNVHTFAYLVPKRFLFSASRFARVSAMPTRWDAWARRPRKGCREDEAR